MNQTFAELITKTKSWNHFGFSVAFRSMSIFWGKLHLSRARAFRPLVFEIVKIRNVFLLGTVVDLPGDRDMIISRKILRVMERDRL